MRLGYYLVDTGSTEISETSLYNLGELQYLNLEANRLHRIPANLLHKNVHKNLRDVRLSFNKLRVVRAGQFTNMAKLQTIVLTGNLIRDVETGGFRDLPNLVTLILSHNKISAINFRSFSQNGVIYIFFILFDIFYTKLLLLAHKNIENIERY